MKPKLAIILISILSLLVSPAAISISNGLDNQSSPTQQSVIVNVEIVDNPSLEDQNWLIISSEKFRQINPGTGKEEVVTIVVRQGPPKTGKDACHGKADKTTEANAAATTCVLNAISVTRSSSEPAGGVTGYVKNYADRYCGGSDCTYYKLTKLEVWWTRIGTGWTVRSARTAWGCNGSCAVCPNNTPYTTLYQPGPFTPDFRGGLTSVTYRYTSSSWPIMKSTAVGIVWGGNNSVVVAPNGTTQSLSVSANY
jgi:hypothetical protein